MPNLFAPGGGSSSGAAGGDLSGTYPNPTVSKINGVPYNADPLAQYTQIAGRAGTANDTILSTTGDGSLYGSVTNAGLVLVANTTLNPGGQISLLPNYASDTGTVQIFSSDLYINSGSAPHQLWLFSNASRSARLRAATGMVADVTSILPAGQGANRTTLHNDGTGQWSWALVSLTTDVSGILPTGNLPLPLDHHTNLTNFTANDDHTQYALLAGRAGGQILAGGTAASDNLSLRANANAVTTGTVNVGDNTGALTGNFAFMAFNASSLAIGAAGLRFGGIEVGFNPQTQLDNAWKIGADQTTGFSRMFTVRQIVQNDPSGTSRNFGLWQGFFFSPTYKSIGAGATVTVPTSRAFDDQSSSILATGTAVNITEHTTVLSKPGFSGGIVTDRRGLWYRDNLGTSTDTNTIAVDVDDLTPSTEAAALRSAITAGAGKYFLHDTGGAQSVLAGTLTAPLRDKGGQVYNVKAYGAVGDGVADDTAAIQSAITTCNSAGGGTVYLPPGTYQLASANGILLSNASNCVIQGAGPNATILRRSGGANTLQHAVGSASSNIQIRDLRILPGTVAGINVNGNYVQALTIENVELDSSTGGYGLITASPNGLYIQRCVFYGNANQSTAERGIQIQEGANNVEIAACRFEYLYDSIVLSIAAGARSDGIRIHDCHFEMGWWLQATKFTNVGTSTYTNTVLTDAGAAFGSLAANTDVRVLPVRQTGTITSNNLPGAEVADTAALFVTNAVAKGDLVRSGTRFATVQTVQSETILWVDEWRDTTTYRPVAGPANGAAYTVYRLVLGRRASNTATTITVTQWYDYGGNVLTGSPPFANGTLYEVMQPVPNYHLLSQAGVTGLIVANNLFRRGWSDQLGLYGNYCTVSGNVIEDGQDVGITLAGNYHTVTRNIIRHQGATGIVASGSDNVITSNEIADSTWQSMNIVNNADIRLLGGDRNVVGQNHLERVGTTQPNSVFGITLGNSAGDPSVGNILQGNVIRGHATASIRFVDSGATGTILDANIVDSISDAGSVGTVFDPIGNSKFLIDTSGNVTKLNNVAQSWPASQGANHTTLHNDGAGNLSWALSSLTTDISGTLPIGNGGTGQTTALAAFNALSVLTTRGDLLTRDASNNARIAIGAAARFLRSNGTDPSWQAIAASDLPAATQIVLDTANATDTTDVEADDYSFTVSDASVTAANIIQAWVFDELDHVAIETRARAGAFDLFMHASDHETEGSLKGKYNVAYTVQ